MLPAPLSPAALVQLRVYLAQNARSPEDYIVGVFKQRDVVLLGEDHAIRHNLKLVQGLVPALYAAGVFFLGMEFGASEDQAALDRLVTGERYDEAAARRLMFNYNVKWAYREYTELYRAAWDFNRSLPPLATRFRILNLSYRYDWDGAPLIRTPENARKIYPHGPVDAYRAGLVQREVLEKGQKILILTGTPHAFTRYRIPVYDFNAPGFVRYEERNLGQLLYRQAPQRVFCILLHQPFPSRLLGGAQYVYPARGAIDQVLAGLPEPRQGFDLPGAPLGDLPDDSFYATGTLDFRLAQLADGYIYQRPFAEYEGCTLDEAFLDGQDWSAVLRQFPDPDWHALPATVEEYWDQVREYADIKRLYGILDPLPGPHPNHPLPNPPPKSKR